MLTIKSDKTSLLDLSIAELRRVAWKHIDVREFLDELADPKLLTRLMYGSGKQILVEMTSYDQYLRYCHEDTIAKMIDAMIALGNTYIIDSSMFYDGKQYSIEFLTKYADYIALNYVERQKSLTPEFVAKYSHKMDMEDFWMRFDRTIGISNIKQFIDYNNGMFRDEIMDSEILQYCTRSDLISLDMEVPDFYDTVMTEQRVMSGDPCNDGQRSYAIWLRKYRRVFNDPEGFPTWNNLLELYKKYPSMNKNSYVDWLYSRAVHNSEEYVSEFDEHLSYNVGEISVHTYQNITDTENSNEAQEAFLVEFSDVLTPTPRRTPARDPATGRFVSSN
ncbi:hypothetical protein GAP32_505 [Cronobacter phage vB_CsaM_GAP32]|uniref:Uncharacterized protein n=1 Tax=Cronobacter phage vB_CsaM_GAP32 TaxID=1141136 RepID=K4F9R4_9CAUD|nr:hypothetical protein GAP32_505 [Cronobacter phage vB_CsaM_GAP32]AFC21965.1 hypothetical protein GAP32_505 [Cronobacter phage vB_CsaM_GAP32]